MSFLNAEWRKLAMCNYIVEPALLQPYLPAGTSLDIWNGKCLLSLIGFYFKNTRLKGIRVPFHVDFEEVNLRFYVKREVNGEIRRGVAFVKEIVSKPMLVFVANTIYKENYSRYPMRYHWKIDQKQQDIEYGWKCKGKWNTIAMQAELEPLEIPVGSEAEFITEHYWGYAQKSDRQSVEYQVTHDRWKHYKILNSTIAVDFACTYGEAFAFLNAQKPDSVLLVEGSVITVEPADKFSIHL